MPTFFHNSKYSSEPNLRLRQAAAVGDLKEVQELLKSANLKIDDAQTGTNPKTNQPFSGSTALHQAVKNNHLQIAFKLIAAGWEPRKLNVAKESAYSLAKDDGFRAQMLMLQRITYLYKALNLHGRFENNNEPLRVLSLACGLSYEALALEAIFKDKEVTFTGVDVDESMCTASHGLCQNIPGADIIHQDATDLEKLKSNTENQRFDLVILRQPDIFNRRAVFEKILVNIIPEMIKSDGILMVSTYHKEELSEVNTLLLKNFDNVKKSYAFLDSKDVFIVENVALTPDKYSLLFTCNKELKLTIESSLNKLARFMT